MRLLFFLGLLLSTASGTNLIAQADPDYLASDSLRRLAETYPDDSIVRKSWLLHRAGLLASRADDKPTAIRLTKQALDLRLQAKDDPEISVVLSAFNLGTYHSSLEEYRKALDYFDLVLLRAPHRKEGVTYFQLGRVYKAMGAFAATEEAFRSAEGYTPFNEDDYFLALLEMERGSLHLDKNNASGGRTAIPLLERALARLEELNTEDYPTDYEQMECYNHLGMAHTLAGNYERALIHLNIAKDYALDFEDEDLPSILLNLGLTYRKLNQPDVAIGYYRQSLAEEMRYGENTVPDDEIATAYDNISTAKLTMGQPDSALYYAQAALRWSVADYTPAGASENPILPEGNDNALNLLVYLQDKARAHNALAKTGQAEHYDHALRAYQLADELLDQMRRDQLLEDTRNYWRADARKLYEEALSVAVDATNPTAAFYFMEKARGRLLLDELSAGRALEDLPVSVRQRLLTAAQQVRSGNKAAAELRRFRRLQDSVFAAHPTYERDRIGAPPPDPSKLASILGDGALVQYFVAEERTIALTWSDENGLALTELAPPTNWREQLTAFRTAVSNPYQTFPLAEARFLFEALVAPLPLPPGQAITCVPDGELYLLPLGALLSADPTDATNYHRWPWLAADRPLRYAFSVQLLHFAQDQRGRGNGRALALAPVARLRPGDAVEAELELPATLRTVRHLAGLFPADTLINAAANHASFRERADAYSLLHLGTHAFLDGAENGGFLLHDATQPRYTKTDMATHQFSADLVVIGACETGLGKQLKGEGVASLGRAFARRGAPGLVMSLWSIDDGSTAELLNATYDGLAAGNGPATALNLAGNSYRQAVTNPSFGHPYYWAGLVAYGPDLPLPMASDGGAWWIWLSGIGLLLLLVVALRRRRYLRPTQ